MAGHGDRRDRIAGERRNSHGFDHEKTSREGINHERKRDRDHYGRYHQRDQKTKDERGNDRSEDHHHRLNHDFQRSRRYNDRDSEKRHNNRVCSPKNSSRNHSRSSSPCKSKRTSGFDMVPSGAPMLPSSAFEAQLPGIPQTIAGIFSSMFPNISTSQFGSLPLMHVQSMTQQATRHARRVYVGGLPPIANEQTIAIFFSHVMTAIGGNAAGPGDSVVNVYINHEKKFAFVEMRSVEEASNAMALDGIVFEGVSVRVRRPTDYNPSLAATLGPSQPSPNLNLAAVGLAPCINAGVDGPDRIFVGGLPYYFSDAQIRELLESFGPLRGFDLVKDKDTGNSKGYGFCSYQDPAVIDIACAALNGLKMGDKTLTLRRATGSNGQVKPEQELILQQAQQHIALQKMALQAGIAPFSSEAGLVPDVSAALPTKVVCLSEVVSADELKNDIEYKEILEDMTEECGKFGLLLNIIIPRPGLMGDMIPGVGKVFLEYADITDSARAKAALNGRKFGGNVVTAVHYPEEKFALGDYEAAIFC